MYLDAYVCDKYMFTYSAHSSIIMGNNVTAGSGGGIGLLNTQSDVSIMHTIIANNTATFFATESKYAVSFSADDASTGLGGGMVRADNTASDQPFNC